MAKKNYVVVAYTMMGIMSFAKKYTKAEANKVAEQKNREKEGDSVNYGVKSESDLKLLKKNSGNVI